MEKSQQEFLQNYPELHSLLTAYLALTDEKTAITEFIQENPQTILQKTQEQLKEVLLNPELQNLVKELTNKDLDLQGIFSYLKQHA